MRIVNNKYTCTVKVRDLTKPRGSRLFNRPVTNLLYFESWLLKTFGNDLLWWNVFEYDRDDEYKKGKQLDSFTKLIRPRSAHISL